MKRFLYRAGLASCFCQFVLFSFKVWLILLFVGCVAGGSWCFFFFFCGSQSNGYSRRKAEPKSKQETREEGGEGDGRRQWTKTPTILQILEIFETAPKKRM